MTEGRPECQSDEEESEGQGGERSKNPQEVSGDSEGRVEEEADGQGGDKPGKTNERRSNRCCPGSWGQNHSDKI